MMVFELPAASMSLRMMARPAPGFVKSAATLGEDVALPLGEVAAGDVGEPEGAVQPATTRTSVVMAAADAAVALRATQ
jgi:hypothetical protein